MKTLILLITTLLTVVDSFSQGTVIVQSNPCDPSSEHIYSSIFADWASSPDMFLPQNMVLAELVLVNDGTTPGIFTNIGTPPISIETTTDACETGTWTQDLTGKIAVIWRGICNFGCKAENAQNRGAIAVIIINHTGEATGMAPGTCGDNVTIPVAMIGRQDGEDLMSCIAGGGVIGIVGSISGLNNNMTSNIGDILMPESLAMPWDLAQNGTEYPIDFGIWTYNNGIAPQNGVTATVDVTYNGSSVYSQISAPVDFAAPDTTYRDSNYFDLGTYTPALWNVGTYTVTYTINDTNDQYLLDNSFTFDFKLTNNNDVYAKCRVDSFSQPIHNTSISLNTGPCYENFESCIVFKNGYAGTRNAIVTGMTFSSTPINFSFANQPIEIRAYQWNDGFIDIFSPVTFNNLSLLDSSIYIYPDSTLIDSNIFLTFNTPILLQDNQRYLFCVLNTSLRTGFDTEINYKTTLNHYLQPINPVSTTDCSSNKNWFRDGFGLDAIPAISVTMDIATNVSETKTEATVYPYPNPTTNLLTLPLRKKRIGKVQLEVFDVLGKMVLSENQVLGNEPLKVNVASIHNGQYIFKITFSDNSTDVFKVSVNR